MSTSKVMDGQQNVRQCTFDWYLHTQSKKLYIDTIPSVFPPPLLRFIKGDTGVFWVHMHVTRSSGGLALG